MQRIAKKDHSVLKPRPREDTRFPGKLALLPIHVTRQQHQSRRQQWHLVVFNKCAPAARVERARSRANRVRLRKEGPWGVELKYKPGSQTLLN